MDIMYTDIDTLKKWKLLKDENTMIIMNVIVLFIRLLVKAPSLLDNKMWSLLNRCYEELLLYCLSFRNFIL